MDKSDVTSLVIESVRQVLSEIDEKNRPKVEILEGSTRLVGREAILSSLGLVSVIVEIEQRLSDDHGIVITIADERALAQERSPFRTVGSLVEYVWLLLTERSQNA